MRFPVAKSILCRKSRTNLRPLSKLVRAINNNLKSLRSFCCHFYTRKFARIQLASRKITLSTEINLPSQVKLAKSYRHKYFVVKVDQFQPFQAKSSTAIHPCCCSAFWQNFYSCSNCVEWSLSSQDKALERMEKALKFYGQFLSEVVPLRAPSARQSWR